jgi:biopolymer transport protein ExbD
MKLKTPREGREMVGDLTPMIDIVFLLIVFFMTVASLLTQQKIEVTIPVAEAAIIPEEQTGRFIISIDESGQIFAGITAVSEQELPAVIQQNIPLFDNFRVLVRADANARHQRVRAVLDACAAVGALDVIFANFQSDQGS